MLLAEFADDYLIYSESRREDPLYYYMKKDDWNSAIGFEVDPLYKEHSERNVTIKVFKDHQDGFDSLNDVDKLKTVRRLLESLMDYFKHWKTINIEGTLSTIIERDVTFPKTINDFEMRSIGDKIQFHRL